MSRRTIYITQQDATQLGEWLRVIQPRHDRDRNNLEVLRRELERAHLIQPDAVPPDVVTMNSLVLIADPTNDQQMRCTLVFPEDAVTVNGRISVLAPLGSGILGRRIGDVVRFQTPGGQRTVRIIDVLYPPEAAEHSHE